MFKSSLASTAMGPLGLALAPITLAESMRDTSKSVTESRGMLEKLNNDDYVHDAFASYVQKKNKVEVETCTGAIINNDETRQYINAIDEYKNLLDKHISLLESGADGNAIKSSLDEINNLK